MVQRAPTSRRTATALLLATSTVLGSLAWHEHTTPVDLAPLAPERAAQSDDSEPALTEAPSLPDAAVTVAAFSEMRARPLFRPDRRPYVPPAIAPPPQPELAPEPPPSETPANMETVEAPPPPAPWPDGLRLVGIVADGSSARRALLRVGGGDVRALEEGGEIAGWRVSRIEPAAATFESAGMRKSLDLFAREAATAAPAGHTPP